MLDRLAIAQKVLISTIHEQVVGVRIALGAIVVVCVTWVSKTKNGYENGEPRTTPAVEISITTPPT